MPLKKKSDAIAILFDNPSCLPNPELINEPESTPTTEPAEVFKPPVLVLRS